MTNHWTISGMLFLCIAFSSTAQVLPVDSITGRIMYTGVVRVDSASADELFSRATLWYSATFKSAKAAMELSDRQSGIITSDPNVNFPAFFTFNNGKRQETGSVTFTLKIQCKDGRFKYELTDLVHIGPACSSMPLERESQLCYRQYLWASLKGEADKSANELIQSLSKAMSSRKVADGGDW